MQHKCAQHKWDQVFLRNYKTNVLLDFWRKKNYKKRKKKHDENTFHQTNTERRKEIFTLSSQC